MKVVVPSLVVVVPSLVTDTELPPYLSSSSGISQVPVLTVLWNIDVINGELFDHDLALLGTF